jgi:hypothetical protein
MQMGGVVYNNNIDVEEMVPREMVERILRDTGFTSVEVVPLDSKDIKAAITRRRARFPEATDIGIQDACAYHGVKPE